MDCCCYLRNVQDLLADGKTPCERRCAEPFNGPVIPFGAMVEYHPISSRDQSRLHQFGKTVLQGIFLGHASIAVGIWKRYFLVADIEESENMDASEIDQRRINAKEVLTPQRCEYFFPSSRLYSKIVRKRPRIPRTHSKAGTTCKERRSQWMTSRRLGRVSTDRIRRWRWSPVDPRWLHLSSSQWTPISNLCAEGRIIPYSTETHWCKKVYSHWSGRHARKRIDDNWNVDSNRRWSDSWKGFTNFTLLKRETSQRIYVVREETDKRLNDYETRSCMAWSMDQNCENRSESRETRMEKREAQTRQWLRGIYFIDPDDHEYKETA